MSTGYEYQFMVLVHLPVHRVGATLAQQYQCSWSFNLTFFRTFLITLLKVVLIIFGYLEVGLREFFVN